MRLSQRRNPSARWVAWVADQGCAPVADWIVLSGQWDETRREAGLEIDKALIARCDAVLLVGGRISPGMQIEKEHAESLGTLVVNLTFLGEDPPEKAHVDQLRRFLRVVAASRQGSLDFFKAQAARFEAELAALGVSVERRYELAMGSGK